jgi:hypothetical protein
MIEFDAVLRQRALSGKRLCAMECRPEAVVWRGRLKQCELPDGATKVTETHSSSREHASSWAPSTMVIPSTHSSSWEHSTNVMPSMAVQMGTREPQTGGGGGA